MSLDVLMENLPSYAKDLKLNFSIGGPPAD